MANTYTQLYVHIIFAVKGRRNLISANHKEELYKYMAGISRNKMQKVLAINGMADHVHILLGIKPTVSLSDLVRDIKSNSSRFINEKRWVKGKFEWQNGFGAFTYSHSQIGRIMKYIRNQEHHHQKRSFREEYVDFLSRFEIDFKNEFLFED